VTRLWDFGHRFATAHGIKSARQDHTPPRSFPAGSGRQIRRAWRTGCDFAPRQDPSATPTAGLRTICPITPIKWCSARYLTF